MRTSSPTSRRRSRTHSPAALAVWLVLSALLTVLAFWAQTVEDESTEDVIYEPAFAVSAAFQYGILLAVAVGLARLFPRPARALGFRRFRLRWLWVALGVILVTVVVGFALEPILHGGEEQGLAPDRWEPEHAGAFAASVVVLVLLGPFAEEVFFRGLGIRVLAGLGGPTAIVVSGVAFGLVHGIPGALPPLVLFGLGLAYVRLRSASVWPGFIAHAAYNGLGILILVIAWATDQPVS